MNSCTFNIKKITDNSSQKINKTFDTSKLYDNKMYSTESRRNESQQSIEFLNLSDAKSSFANKFFKPKIVKQNVGTIKVTQKSKILSAKPSSKSNLYSNASKKPKRNFSSKVKKIIKAENDLRKTLNPISNETNEFRTTNNLSFL